MSDILWPLVGAYVVYAAHNWALAWVSQSTSDRVQKLSKDFESLLVRVKRLESHQSIGRKRGVE